MPHDIDLPQSVADGMSYPLAYTESGSGAPLLLIHGSLCDYRYWRWQIPAFGQAYRTLAPSLRGYWPAAFRSERADFDVLVQTRDLIEFLDHTSPDGTPVHVLGHSRGARVALELACAAPEKVRTLTLADPGFSPVGQAGPVPFQIEAARRLSDGDTDGALEVFIDTVSGSDTWRHMVGWFKAMVRDNAGTLLSQIKERHHEFDMARAGAISCPTLLLTGSDSPARFGRVLASLEQVLPHVEKTTIPLASHGMNLANPRVFNQHVLGFLGSHS
ncbi:MAG TPA: alpha/beta hydrolase [Burkholderiaceae bacterium]|nr:alpha/beta hydrolase [Burkholderiaceae bacterium]